MPLKLYNTLTRKKEFFKPIKKNSVSMYTCGPTVYDYAHIGNFRAYVVADLLKRYLKFKGFKVKHIMNITDVDDKTIRDSQKEGASLKEFTGRYARFFFEDLESLNILKADFYPKATEHIKDMVKIINNLIKKKIAYKSEDGSIYYDISRFKKYGKFARLDFKGLKVGARIKQDEYEKESASDFALWKAWDEKDGNVFWNTNLGKGRPGWHIECSAMSMKYLGKNFDIHTGGVDLIFPHHENEIAQSEAFTGKKFVNYWVHNEHLLVDGKKMSKSFGNFYTLRDLLNKGFDSKAIRFVLLSTHYRQQLNFTFESVEAEKNSLERIEEFILKLKNSNGKDKLNIDKFKKEFENAMDDDLNISKASSIFFELIKEANKNELSEKESKKVLRFVGEIDKVLGLNLFEEKKIPKEIIELAERREDARKEKNWKTADEIRKEINKKGFIIGDKKEGYLIRRRSDSKSIN